MGRVLSSGGYFSNTSVAERAPHVRSWVIFGQILGEFHLMFEGTPIGPVQLSSSLGSMLGSPKLCSVLGSALKQRLNI